MRLEFGVDIDADGLTIVVRPVHDFECAAAHAQCSIGSKHEHARRSASAVLPRREFLLPALCRPVAGLHEVLARVLCEGLPGVRPDGLCRVFTPGVMQDSELLRGLSFAH
jgi:hypothetical protein